MLLPSLRSVKTFTFDDSQQNGLSQDALTLSELIIKGEFQSVKNNGGDNCQWECSPASDIYWRNLTPHMTGSVSLTRVEMDRKLFTTDLGTVLTKQCQKIGAS